MQLQEEKRFQRITVHLYHQVKQWQRSNTFTAFGRIQQRIFRYLQQRIWINRKLRSASTTKAFLGELKACWHNWRIVYMREGICFCCFYELATNSAFCVKLFLQKDLRFDLSILRLFGIVRLFGWLCLEHLQHKSKDITKTFLFHPSKRFGSLR